MAALWEGPLDEPSLEAVRQSRIGAAQGWPDDAATIFRPERLSLFTGDDDGYGRVCLVWFEGSEEPEVWSYDANGEPRCLDLQACLRAHLDGDLSVAFRPWRLEFEGLHGAAVDAPTWDVGTRWGSAWTRRSRSSGRGSWGDPPPARWGRAEPQNDGMVCERGRGRPVGVVRENEREGRPCRPCVPPDAPIGRRGGTKPRAVASPPGARSGDARRL